MRKVVRKGWHHLRSYPNRRLTPAVCEQKRFGLRAVENRADRSSSVIFLLFHQPKHFAPPKNFAPFGGDFLSGNTGLYGNCCYFSSFSAPQAKNLHFFALQYNFPSIFLPISKSKNFLFRFTNLNFSLFRFTNLKKISLQIYEPKNV